MTTKEQRAKRGRSPTYREGCNCPQCIIERYDEEPPEEAEWRYCIPCGVCWNPETQERMELVEWVRRHSLGVDRTGATAYRQSLSNQDCSKGHRKAGGLVNLAWCLTCRKLLELYEEPDGKLTLPLHMIGGGKCEGSYQAIRVAMRPSRYTYEYEYKPKADHEAEEAWARRKTTDALEVPDKEDKGSISVRTPAQIACSLQDPESCDACQ